MANKNPLQEKVDELKTKNKELEEKLSQTPHSLRVLEGNSPEKGPWEYVFFALNANGNPIDAELKILGIDNKSLEKTGPGYTLKINSLGDGEKVTITVYAPTGDEGSKWSETFYGSVVPKEPVPDTPFKELKWNSTHGIR